MARSDSYRSRAVFKLIELNKIDVFIKQGMSVIDLGAAPGSWSQFVVKKVGAAGLVIAVDREDIEPISGVKVIKGDFTSAATLDAIRKICAFKAIDLVISDLAPNLTGVDNIDQSQMRFLVERAATFATSVLTPNGAFVAKFFEGGEAGFLREHMSNLFDKCQVKKPKASRSSSREAYFVAKRPKDRGVKT